ncbi:ATP-binding cassette domain-containing protein, partial [Moraxella catarrhalis]
MIEFKNVAVRREGRLLFSDVNFQLHKGQKIGLTGNNGTGKSTLFATILGTHNT